MVEPRIQYAKTEDGVNIAYSGLGDGAPFVILDLPSHLAAEWRASEATYTQLASEVQVVRLDHRGFGLSDRTFDDVSLDAYASDLEAVVDKLDLSRFILYTTSPPTTAIAIAYTARHPERVTRMLLNGYVRTPEIVGQQIEATLNMPGTDWQFVSEALARIFRGWGDEETARRMAAHFRRSVDLDGFKRFSESFRHWDVSDLLPLLATPALVTCRDDDDPRWGVEQARALAAGLLNAQLVTLDAATHTERLAQRNAAVRAFLGAPAQPDEIALPSGTAIILFLDIAGSTALTTKLGDAAYRERERELDSKLRAAITDAGGTPVEGKVLGDGVMAVFTSARCRSRRGCRGPQSRVRSWFRRRCATSRAPRQTSRSRTVASTS